MAGPNSNNMSRLPCRFRCYSERRRASDSASSGHNKRGVKEDRKKRKGSVGFDFGIFFFLSGFIFILRLGSLVWRATAWWSLAPMSGRAPGIGSSRPAEAGPSEPAFAQPPDTLPGLLHPSLLFGDGDTQRLRALEEVGVLARGPPSPRMARMPPREPHFTSLRGACCHPAGLSATSRCEALSPRFGACVYGYPIPLFPNLWMPPSLTGAREALPRLRELIVRPPALPLHPLSY